MLITKRSALTGIVHARDVPGTDEQLKAWRNGGKIQDVMPYVAAELREFVLSGVTPEEWKKHMHFDDDEDVGRVCDGPSAVGVWPKPKEGA